MIKTKNNQIIVYCPECMEKVMTHDGKGKIPISNLCKKCKKIVTYFPETKKTTIKNKPRFDSSSGKRVY